MKIGDHITCGGDEYELACRCKCASMKGWLAHPCDAEGTADARHEKWIADEEITGVLDAKTRQFRI